MLFLNLLETSSTFGLSHQFVHSAEVGPQGLAVLPILELLKLDKLFNELLLNPYTDLFATVTIKDTEDANAVT
jgi:hypothetical protein